MAKVKKTGTTRKMRPAITPEARENQMISLAAAFRRNSFFSGDNTLFKARQGAGKTRKRET